VGMPGNVPPRRHAPKPVSQLTLIRDGFPADGTVVAERDSYPPCRERANPPLGRTHPTFWLNACSLPLSRKGVAFLDGC